MPEALLTIGAYSTWFEAHLIKSELEAFDLHPIVVDAHTVNMNWLWSNAIGGVKVQIPASEAEEARRILELDPAEPQTEFYSNETAATACPLCGSTDTQFQLDKRGSYLTWLMLSIPLLPPVSKRTCANCGSKWKV